jgi:hypothetical protein
MSHMVAVKPCQEPTRESNLSDTEPVEIRPKYPELLENPFFSSWERDRVRARMPPTAHPRAHLTTLSLTLALAAGCAHSPGPAEVAAAYARALEEGRLEEAHALTNLPPEERPAFLEHYTDPESRRARAQEVLAALPELRATAPSLTLTHGIEGWRVVEQQPGEAPRATLGRFLDAVEAGEWSLAWSLLHGPLRARYTPERLREDFQREPLAPERLRRARLAWQGPVRVTRSGAEFPLGDERAVRLVREGGAWRVAAIE